MGSKIERINNFISQKLTALDKTEITAVEMARYLDEVGILKDNRSRPGLPLRNFLRSGAIIGGYQTSTNRWLIKRSSESKKLISVSTAAQKLNLSEPAIYKKIKDNEINVRRMGQKRILIPENEIVRIRSKENEKIAKGEVENILNIREKLGKEMSFLKEEITFINHRILKMERILLSIENNEKISENHKIILNTNGNEYETLADILPEKPGLRVLFVAKRPAPVSVKIGHYFQGRQGKLFWSSLKRYGFFDVPIGIYEDDFLLKHKYGIVDIVKIPRKFGEEPSDSEYREGSANILDLIKIHKPKVTVFIYKRVLDQILKIEFSINKKSKYGFNDELDDLFGSKIFVFPMPGTPCRAEEAEQFMLKLKDVLNK